MLMLPAGLRVSIYREPVDMRRSFDGLEALVREGLGADPLSGELFVFCNRRRDRMKLLLWDETGFWIWGSSSSPHGRAGQEERSR